jgi:hypothetical protein
MPYVLFKNYNNNNSAGYCGRGASSSNQIYLTAYSGNALGLGANNSDNIVYINTSGNVGVGTTSPSYKLHVSGYIGLHEGLVFTRQSWNYICVPSTSGVLSFNIGAAGTANTKMCIANNGYVGIGTTGPSYLLDVNGSTRTGHHYMSGYLWMNFGGEWLSTIDNDGNGPIFGY